jgi:serine/threonine protein kinase
MPKTPPFAHPSTVALPLVPGRRLGGKYELIRRLGAGSMGEVWMATHRTLGERVAIKILVREDECSRLEDAVRAAARFRFEAQVAARLSRGSPYIIRVTDHGEEGALAYLVMELLDGQSLETWLLRRGPVEPRLLAPLLHQVARALEHAHSQGVVHRDLKPGNIFIIRDENGTPRVKLLDFGIARSVVSGREPSPFATASNVILGTPGYMSPEHADGATPPDQHCDLWALATVAYEALTCELPVPGLHGEELIENLHARRLVPIRQRNKALPEALDGFFSKAFALRIEDRFTSASELAIAFERALGRGQSGAPTAFVRRPRQSTDRGSRHAPNDGSLTRRVGFAAIVVACVLGAAVSWHSMRRTGNGPPYGAAMPAETMGPAAPRDGTVAPIEPRIAEARAATESPVAADATSDVTPAAPASAATGLDASARPRTERYPDRSCAAPYEYDANGIKRWKRACL